MIFFIVLLSSTISNINDVQSVGIWYYNNSCHNQTITNYEHINVPTKCNCFTSHKQCKNKITNKIKFPNILNSDFFLQYFRNNPKEDKCVNLKNNTYFKFNYYITNQYCNHIILVFSILFTGIIFVLGFIFLYDMRRRIRNRQVLYQRLNEIAETEFDSFLNT